LLLRAERVLPGRCDAGSVLARDGQRAASCGIDDLGRPEMGRVDGEGEEVVRGEIPTAAAFLRVVLSGARRQSRCVLRRRSWSLPGIRHDTAAGGDPGCG